MSGFSCSKIDDTARIYKDVSIKKSIIKSECSIGDRTQIFETTLHSNVEINRQNSILRSSVGDFTYTGINTSIRSSTIGKFCSISWLVTVGGLNHKLDNLSTYRMHRFTHKTDKTPYEDNQYASEHFSNVVGCVVGNDVWIGSNAVILSGVEIGDGAVIGAGAVVTKDVEPYSIVAGVPAKKIRYRFDKETIELLLELKWWDLPIDIIKENSNKIFNQKLEKKQIVELLELKRSISKS